MNYLKLYTKNILSFAIIITVLASITTLFYLRFLRERLPKDVPFTLAEISFIIIIIILVTYSLIIKQHFFPTIPPTIVLKAHSFIGHLFSYVDAYIKHNKTVHPYYHKIVCYFGKFNTTDIIFCYNLFTHILLAIVPRIILLLFFIFDIFILQKIEIFYYVIPLGIIPIIYRYFLYSITFAVNQYTTYLESFFESILLIEKGNRRMNDMYVQSDYDNDEFLGKHNPHAIYHDEFVTIRKYIEIHTEIALKYDENNDKHNYIYESTPVASENLYIQYCIDNNKKKEELTETDKKTLCDNFLNLSSKIIILNAYLQVTKQTQEMFFIKHIKLIFYMAYLCAWLYILIISFHTLQGLPWTLYVLKILEGYAPGENPFM